jgi:hypothetical protein
MPRLHYLYEQAGDGKARFVYYCSACTCVFEVRKNLGPAGAINGPPDRRCAGCGRPLAGSVECTFAPVPEDWSDVLVTQPPQKRTELFQQASSIPHFCLGFPRLDSLLRPLAEGRLVMFSGEPSSVVAELAAFRAQLPVGSGGLDSGVLFIDGGNRSDPYTFSSFAKQRGVKPAAAMRRVTSCRVFTFYQLAALVSEHLERATEDYGTKLVIISDVLGTFNEPELEEREARRVLTAIQEGVEKTKKHALVIATLPSSNRYDDLVASWSDAMIQMSSDGSRIRAELIRHRNRLPGAATFRLSEILRATKTGAAN